MATAFKIEKGIPAPTGRAFKYPFDDMEPGDSFVAPEDVGVRRAVSAHANRHNRKFTCRKISADKMRVWRIA